MKITKATIHRMIGEELESVIKEGFGGELSEKDRAEFEKVRMSNAEVLGYKLTGKPDVKLKQEDKLKNGKFKHIKKTIWFNTEVIYDK